MGADGGRGGRRGVTLLRGQEGKCNSVENNDTIGLEYN